MTRIVVFANGLIPDLELVRHLIHPDDTLAGVDGGSHYLLALGLLPSIAIGDMDSLAPEDLQSLQAQGVKLLRYSHDKDETDLELALHYAYEAGHREILIVGALGDRLDQTLGNLSLLTNPEFDSLDVRMDDGVEEVFITRSRCEVAGKPGEIVSLIPWGEPATGVCTEGLRWPLRSETLFPDRTRGISNELLQETAAISLTSGILFVIHQRKLGASQQVREN